MSTKVVISCEHAGNQVPEAFQYLFSEHQQILESHRGWDPGALEIAEYLAKQLKAPLYYRIFTRLLIELNRSLHHPALYSEYSISLAREIKAQLIRDYYDYYRNEVEKHIAAYIRENQNTFHLSVHTFTPVYNGIHRAVDIGLLFDPERPEELAFCIQWKKKLEALLPQMKIRFNEPYLGTDDGFTTYLRTKFPSSFYVGIEIEVNQLYIERAEWKSIQQTLSVTCAELI